MANMSYCRFENTLYDLQDCYEALQDVGGVENYINDKHPSEEEKEAIFGFIKLCSNIVSEFRTDNKEKIFSLDNLRKQAFKYTDKNDEDVEIIVGMSENELMEFIDTNERKAR